MDDTQDVQTDIFMEWQQAQSPNRYGSKPVAEFEISFYKDLTKPVLLSCNPLMAEYYRMEAPGAETVADAQS